MKIEMGESLIFSWLKHAKECKIVQLNWKPSDFWNTTNEQEAIDLFKIIEQHFPVFKNSKYDQLIKQAEIDALGLGLDESQENYYYAVDIAYHENGLNYGAKAETIERISKKIIRTALILYTYFNTKKGDIIFASPKINPAIYYDLNSQICKIDEFFKNMGFEYNFKLIANEDFTKSILNPIIEISSNVADTSELFMRAFQLSNLCNIQNKKTLFNNMNNGDYNEFKIGALVKNKLGYLFKNNFLNENEIKKLKDIKYCKDVFNLNYPMIISIDESRYDKKEHARYWNAVFGEKYYVCNNWFENQRNAFETWYNSIIDKITANN